MPYYVYLDNMVYDNSDLRRQHIMDKLGRDDLFYCIADSNEQRALELIEQIKDIDYQDKNGYSYLHIAVQSGLLIVVEKLLVKGAKVDIIDKFGKTPLMVAVSGYNGDRTLIDLLIRSGADINRKNETGISAQKVAEMKGISLQ